MQTWFQCNGLKGFIRTLVSGLAQATTEYIVAGPSGRERRKEFTGDMRLALEASRSKPVLIDPVQLAQTLRGIRELRTGHAYLRLH